MQTGCSPKDLGVSEDKIRKQAAAWAERTAIEQGLPQRVMDIAVLCQVLYLLGLVELERSLLE